ncbi:transcriptional regulatory protein LEU3 [Microdochium nivale]|nr:transcriptional regulatory protein LEU3 [Microdochium nivale]
MENQNYQNPQEVGQEMDLSGSPLGNVNTMSNDIPLDPMLDLHDTLHQAVQSRNAQPTPAAFNSADSFMTSPDGDVDPSDLATFNFDESINPSSQQGHHYNGQQASPGALQNQGSYQPAEQGYYYGYQVGHGALQNHGSYPPLPTSQFPTGLYGAQEGFHLEHHHYPQAFGSGQAPQVRQANYNGSQLAPRALDHQESTLSCEQGTNLNHAPGHTGSQESAALGSNILNPSLHPSLYPMPPAPTNPADEPYDLSMLDSFDSQGSDLSMILDEPAISQSEAPPSTYPAIVPQITQPTAPALATTAPQSNQTPEPGTPSPSSSPRRRRRIAAVKKRDVRSGSCDACREKKQLCKPTAEDSSCCTRCAKKGVPCQRNAGGDKRTNATNEARLDGLLDGYTRVARELATLIVCHRYQKQHGLLKRWKTDEDDVSNVAELLRKLKNRSGGSLPTPPGVPTRITAFENLRPSAAAAAAASSTTAGKSTGKGKLATTRAFQAAAKNACLRYIRDLVDIVKKLETEVLRTPSINVRKLTTSSEDNGDFFNTDQIFRLLERGGWEADERAMSDAERRLVLDTLKAEGFKCLCREDDDRGLGSAAWSDDFEDLPVPTAAQVAAFEAGNPRLF